MLPVGCAQLFLQYSINGPNCSAYLFYTNPQSTYVYTLGIGIIANISLLPSYLLRGIRFNTNVNTISGSWFKGCFSDFILILKLRLTQMNGDHHKLQDRFQQVIYQIQIQICKTSGLNISLQFQMHMTQPQC